MKKTSGASALFILLLCLTWFLQCGDDDDDDNDDSSPGDDDDNNDNDSGQTDDDDALEEPVFTINFEDYPVGPLADPWVIEEQAGASAIAVQSLTKDGVGKVLVLDGGKADADELEADYGFNEVEEEFWIEFEVFTQDDDGVCAFQVLSQTEGYYRVEIELNLDEGTLWAVTDRDPWERVGCGAVAADQWHLVEISMDFSRQTYDVWIDGVLNACNDLAQLIALSGPYAGLSIIDLPYEGNGGVFMFDHFVGYTYAPAD